MKTYNVAALSRSAGLFVLLAALCAIAIPAWAAPATCNGSPKAGINPLSLTVTETTAGVPTVVQLSGSGSTPANGNLTYAWEYLGSTPTGFTVTLANATTNTPSFTVPNVPSGGAALHFKLTVCGIAATAATTDVNVTDVVVNSPPTAVGLATPAIATEGTLVTLDGSGSFDSDPGTTLTYSWSQVGAQTVTLSNANPAGSIVTFAAPNTPVTTGASLTFRLTVSDGNLTGSTDKTVNVVWTNDPPVASLVCPGGVFVVDEGDLVTLDGSGSSDSDGTINSYAWTQETGLPDLGIGGLIASSISFNAPHLGLNQLGGVNVILTVTDSSTASTTAECGVFINDVTPPVLTVPGDFNAQATSSAGANVAYSASAQDAVDDELPRVAACTPASNTVFPLGESTVECSATDTAGNSASKTFKITVVDTTKPVLQAHDDVAFQATSAAGAIVTFDDPIVTDTVDAAPTITCIPASGSQFPLGGSSVQCSAVDHAGNSADPIVFAVNVLDTEAPVVTPPADVATEATGPQTLVDYGTATATDAVGVASITSNAPADSRFPVGQTTIVWTAKDAAGNAGNANSTVTVTDKTPPVIDAQTTIPDVEATSAAGAAVHYAYPATHDLVDGIGAASCLPASDSTFALGTTEVTCTATDAHGNHATATRFNVSVVDTTAPTIESHDAISGVEATSADGAVVTYVSPVTHDAVDGPGTATCTPASGATFALGTHTVTCSATDAHDNTTVTPTTFDVTVVDTTAPVVTPPADVTTEATGPRTVVAYATATATDLVGVTSIDNDAPADFPVGLTTIAWTATDAAGNAGHANSTVTVTDTTAPVIAHHDDVGPVEATGAGGAIVTYSLPSTSDLVDGNGSASCSPLSGALFPLGSTVVACAAIDDAGNEAHSTFTVTVRDHTAPVIAAHANLSAEATGPTGAVVAYVSPGTIDAVDGNGFASCTPVSGSTFPLGSNTVTCYAVDAALNHSAPTAFTITVTDHTAPTIAPHADVTVTATANSGAVVNYTLPTATDLVDLTVPVTCAAAAGTTFTVGSTTVNCSATDHAGNTATSSFKVIVSYSFSGFYRPVDNLPMVNVVKAGSAIPVKFSLGGDQGLNIFAPGYPASVSNVCGAAATDAIEETVTAGGSSLSYDAASGQYIYVWKTDKSWAGGCRQLQVKLRDGSSRSAAFNFTR